MKDLFGLTVSEVLIHGHLGPWSLGRLERQDVRRLLSPWWPGSRQREQGTGDQMCPARAWPAMYSPRKIIHLNRCPFSHGSISIFSHWWGRNSQEPILSLIPTFEHCGLEDPVSKTRVFRGHFTCKPRQLPVSTCRPHSHPDTLFHVRKLQSIFLQ